MALLARRTLLASSLIAPLSMLARPLWGASRDTVLTCPSSVDGSDQPYAVYAPENLANGRRYGLIVSLHGAGQDHHRGLRQCLQTNTPDCVVVAPYGRGSMGYEGIAESDVYDVVEDARRRYPIDADRVCLTGVSMGGSGTYSLALRRPDVWAAIAPVCGGAPDGLPEMAGNASDLPVRMRHGDRDETVPVAVAREWRGRFERAGNVLDYREYPGAGHNIAAQAYADGQTLTWLQGFRRDRFPARVNFSSREYTRSSAYWVQLDCFAPDKPGSVDARFQTVGALEIATRGVSGFSLRLNEHPSARNLSEIAIDGEKPRFSGNETLHFARSSNTWRQVPAPHTGKRRAGCDGPVKTVFSAKHSYVFGTQGADAGSDDVWARREIAQRAADWAGWKARPAVTFPVAADADMVRGRLSDNAVVFGTERTNLLLKHWAKSLPMRLREQAASTWGLVFVYPVEERLAAVNSGLPWWTRASREQRESFRWQWLSLPYRLASTFPDFVLFRESIQNIKVSGYFDENWHLPAEAREKLAATKVVEF